MNKKILSAVICSAMVISSASAFAADKEIGQPDVYVNSSKIIFADQTAQIVNDRTLVPARGVFEAMGNKIEWDSETRTVTAESSTGVTVVTITIDSDKMKVRTYKSIMEADEKTVELDVPAQIINDRTMIPLRAVSEAFNSTVEWDADNFCVNITTGEPARLEGAVVPTPVPVEEKVTMSLSTDAADVKAGDEFTVYVDVDNFVEGSYMSGITATFSYDKSLFEYVSGTLLNDESEAYEATLGADNPEYETGCKLAFVTIDAEKARRTDGHVFAMTLKALTDNGGSISLVNEYVPKYGYGSCLMFNIDSKDTMYDGEDIIVDTTPITIGK